MKLISTEIEDYLDIHTSAEPVLLQKLRRETYQKTTHPHMLSGVYQGRLLSMLSKFIQPKTIVELGTFTGYSALCLAEGLVENGKLYTIDPNDELVHLSQKYFDLSDYQSQIVYKNGFGLEIIPNLTEKFDLVFLDADKKTYPAYLDMLIDKMNVGGVILADNVLWYGKVMEKAKENDVETLALQEFNRKVVENNQLEVVILPIRDGLSLIRKKK